MANAAQLWNQLPDDITCTPTVAGFKIHLPCLSLSLSLTHTRTHTHTPYHTGAHTHTTTHAPQFVVFVPTPCLQPFFPEQMCPCKSNRVSLPLRFFRAIVAGGIKF